MTDPIGVAPASRFAADSTHARGETANPGATPAQGSPTRFRTLVDQKPASFLLADPRRTGVLFSITNVALYSLLALAQWTGWGGLIETHGIGYRQVLVEGLLVAAVNLGFGLLTIGIVFAIHPATIPARRRYLVIALIAIITAIPRALVLTAILPSTPSHAIYFVSEWLAGLITGFVAVAAGVLGAQLLRNIRSERDERLDAAERAARAVDDLQSEEMRVRRMVSDQLHGNLQFRLLTVTAGLDAVAAHLAESGDSEHAASVRSCTELLEEVRETEVRSLSHAVFPSGIELGLSCAVDALLRRLPPQIESNFSAGANYQRFIDDAGVRMPLADRLVAVYAIEEAVTNALKHGRATAVDVYADVLPDPDQDGWVLDVAVSNNGKPLDTDAGSHLNGLARHYDRIASRGGSLDLADLPNAGGAKLHFSMPFTLETEFAPVSASPVNCARPVVAE